MFLRMNAEVFIGRVSIIDLKHWKTGFFICFFAVKFYGASAIDPLRSAEGPQTYVLRPGGICVFKAIKKDRPVQKEHAVRLLRGHGGHQWPEGNE